MARAGPGKARLSIEMKGARGDVGGSGAWSSARVSNLCVPSEEGAGEEHANDGLEKICAPVVEGSPIPDCCPHKKNRLGFRVQVFGSRVLGVFKPRLRRTVCDSLSMRYNLEASPQLDALHNPKARTFSIRVCGERIAWLIRLFRG